MGKKRPGRTKEQIIKDFEIISQIFAHARTRYPDHQIHFVPIGGNEVLAECHYSLVVLTCAGLVVHDPDAPANLRNHATRIIERVRDNVCLDLGGPPRKGISLYSLDYGIIEKIREAHREYKNDGSTDRMKYILPLIDYIKERIKYGTPIAPGWEEGIKKVIWKRRKESTVLIETLCILTGREKSSVGKEIRKLDKAAASAREDWDRRIESLKQKTKN